MSEYVWMCACVWIEGVGRGPVIRSWLQSWGTFESWMQTLPPHTHTHTPLSLSLSLSPAHIHTQTVHTQNHTTQGLCAVRVQLGSSPRLYGSGDRDLDRGMLPRCRRVARPNRTVLVFQVTPECDPIPTSRYVHNAFRWATNGRERELILITLHTQT